MNAESLTVDCGIRHRKAISNHRYNTSQLSCGGFNWTCYVASVYLAMLPVLALKLRYFLPVCD